MDKDVVYIHNGIFSSVQVSLSVVSDSLQPHELQHARPPCPSPTPGVYSNSCPLSQWCHPTTSSSVVPFSFRLQSFPASGSFPMSQLFSWGGQSIGVSVSASILPMNTQDWSPLGWTGWISLLSKGLSTPQFKSINSLVPSFLYSPALTSIHDYWKTIALSRWTHKKEWSLAICCNMDGPEGYDVMLSEMSQTEKDKSHMISHLCRI